MGRRRLTFALMATALVTFVTGLVAGSASALDVSCIEASRYRHLYRLFGDDPRAFATYLQIDPARLPGPAMCRAALVSGGIDGPDDTAKLIDFVTQNRGWLASLQLASSGGRVGTGYQLAMITRSFWLKTATVALSDGKLAYVPDFIVPPNPPLPGAAAPDPMARGWEAYQAALKALPAVTPPQTRCASACGLIHAAGIERSGLIRVHRSRYSGSSTFIDLSKPMAATNEGLMRSEEMQIAFYRQMDAGDEFIRTYQATPPETTTPVPIGRYPRYVADHLNARCKLDAGQLQRLERQIEKTIADLGSPLFGLTVKTDRLRAASRKVHEQRTTAEQCVAAAQERERLAAFERLCAGGCAREHLLAMVDGKIREIGKAGR
jgi:hypothetical protein